MTYKKIIVICLVVSCFYGKTSITGDIHTHSSNIALTTTTPAVAEQTQSDQGQTSPEHNDVDIMQDEDIDQEKSYNMISEHSSTNMHSDIRNVEFEDDLYRLQELAAHENKDHLESFNELDVIIEAVNRYRCPRGQTVKVTIKNNLWKIAIRNIPQNLLIDCVPIPDLLSRKTCKSWLDRYANAMSHYLAKVMIYIWGKTLASRAKCSVVIHSNVHSDLEKDDFQCSEIILDVIELSEHDAIDIQKNWKSPLNIELTISKK